MPQPRLPCLFLSGLLIPSLLTAQTEVGKPGVCAIPIPVAREVGEVEMLKPATPKLERDLLSLPLSATVSDAAFLDSAVVRSVKDAAIHAPGVFFNEFTARRASQPVFRGIGGSPMNPGVTTFIDGVPQFSANSSSLELLDVEQIDFVRGPAGPLFGRNTAGGLIGITSRRPSLTTWGGSAESTFGNYNLYDFRGSITGPLIQDQLGFSFAGGHGERDGFSEDATTGRDIDNRSSWFGKAQFLWQPDDRLEVRFILAAESADDGDYALQDVTSLRRRERKLTSNFYGHTKRDVIQPTLQITYHADSFDHISTTGLVWWQTEDLTDFDYSGLPLLIHRREEEMLTLTQEFRFKNPEGRPVELCSQASLQWQAGAFFFYSSHEQNIANTQDLGFLPVPESFTQGDFDDIGLGLYGQGILTLWGRLDLLAGLRLDLENKEASGRQIVVPGGTSLVDDSRSFAALTPQVALSYRFKPDLMGYFSFSGGYKAGGFNIEGPAEYEEERTWNYELGLKGRAFKERLDYTFAAFCTQWTDMQLVQPSVAGGFFLDNAGDASSHGVELALNYRCCDRLSLFSTASWQGTEFGGGARDSGEDIGGRSLPYAPDYNVTFGAVANLPLNHSVSLYARADIQFIGAFEYTPQNRSGQNAYALANFRLGIRGHSWFTEFFVNNAFNTDYVPVAMNYPVFGTQRIIGEAGAPCTFGIRTGIKF
jgi:iron complex outermembrane recepter protein